MNANELVETNRSIGTIYIRKRAMTDYKEYQQSKKTRQTTGNLVAG